MPSTAAGAAPGVMTEFGRPRHTDLFLDAISSRSPDVTLPPSSCNHFAPVAEARPPPRIGRKCDFLTARQYCWRATLTRNFQRLNRCAWGACAHGASPRRFSALSFVLGSCSCKSFQRKQLSRPWRRKASAPGHGRNKTPRLSQDIVTVRFALRAGISERRSIARRRQLGPRLGRAFFVWTRANLREPPPLFLAPRRAGRRARLPRASLRKLVVVLCPQSSCGRTGVFRWWGVTPMYLRTLALVLALVAAHFLLRGQSVGATRPAAHDVALSRMVGLRGATRTAVGEQPKTEAPRSTALLTPDLARQAALNEPAARTKR